MPSSLHMRVGQVCLHAKPPHGALDLRRAWWRNVFKTGPTFSMTERR
jgi:hypothetical protein